MFEIIWVFLYLDNRLISETMFLDINDTTISVPGIKMKGSKNIKLNIIIGVNKYEKNIDRKLIVLLIDKIIGKFIIKSEIFVTKKFVIFDKFISFMVVMVKTEMNTNINE